MSETTHGSEPAAPPPPQTDDPHDSQQPAKPGSLGAGIAYAWLIAVIGHPLLLMAFAPLGLFLPELIIIGLAVLMYGKGHSKTGSGLLLGLASVVAVALLLVAACFGVIGLGSYH
ncbi:MAG: hypothetical protein WBW92_00415 [Rhodanobacteraceae bacterium]